LVVLTAEDAERIGVDLEWLEFNAPILTANGRAMTARMVLDNINIGGIEVSNVNALITQPGLLTHSLLGMSYLSKLTKFEIKGDQLVLYR
ncbi:MAG: TIGR02281 family clan AA aspartic protease, partial [Fimbriimonadaceae bacterium]|nr:TIGR02281 family clan AA aspartic protease [Alphaproteobacteria bacterium]